MKLITHKKNSSNIERAETELRSLEAFAEWPSVCLRRLLSASRLMWYSRGDVIAGPEESSDLLVLVEGHALHRMRSAFGNLRPHAPLVMGLRGPGMLLGWGFIFQPKEYEDVELIANSDSMAIHIPWKYLLEILDKDPAKWKAVGRMMLEQERALIDLSIGQITGKLRDRLIFTLQQVAGRWGVREANKKTVRINLSQDVLASMLQVSRRTINKELNSLVIDGVLKLQYGSIEIIAPCISQKRYCDLRDLESNPTTRFDSINGESWLIEYELRKSPAFKNWPASAMNSLTSSAKIIQHDAGAFIASNEKSPLDVFFITSGSVAISLLKNDSSQSFALCGSGTLPNLSWAIKSDGHAEYRFDANEQVTAIHMPAQAVLSSLDQNPILWKSMLYLLLEQHASIARTLRDQADGPLQQSAAACIARLADLHGIRNDCDSSIQLQISQATLASLLQASPQSVNKALKLLASHGLIVLGYNFVRVDSIDQLQFFCNSISQRFKSE